jgi:hypothetical protein
LDRALYDLPSKEATTGHPKNVSFKDFQLLRASCESNPTNFFPFDGLAKDQTQIQQGSTHHQSKDQTAHPHKSIDNTIVSSIELDIPSIHLLVLLL